MKKWGSYHKSRSHSDDQCYRQINGSRSSPADSKSTKDETLFANSNVTGCGSKFCCKSKGEYISNESNDELYSPPPGIRFTLLAACHLPLSQQGNLPFRLLAESGLSKHFIDPELIRRVES